MYKLQYLNIVIETDSEMRKNELISIGYELVNEISQAEDTADKTSENEISSDADISEEQSEDNTDETDEENKAGKKSGKAKK